MPRTGVGTPWPKPQRLAVSIVASSASSEARSPGSCPSFHEPLRQLEAAAAADPARRARPAVLVVGEAPHVQQQVRARDAFVEGDEAAVAELDPALRERLDREGHVELVRCEEAAQRAARSGASAARARRGGRRPARSRSTRAARRARPRRRPDARSAEFRQTSFVPSRALRAAPRVRVAAALDDPLQCGERLDVVHDGRRAVEAAAARREGRPRGRGSAEPFHRVQQRGLLAGDVRAGAFEDLELEVEARAVDVRAEVAGRAGLRAPPPAARRGPPGIRSARRRSHGSPHTRTPRARRPRARRAGHAPSAGGRRRSRDRPRRRSPPRSAGLPRGPCARAPICARRRSPRRRVRGGRRRRPLAGPVQSLRARSRRAPRRSRPAGRSPRAASGRRGRPSRRRTESRDRCAARARRAARRGSLPRGRSPRRGQRVRRSSSRGSRQARRSPL